MDVEVQSSKLSTENPDKAIFRSRGSKQGLGVLGSTQHLVSRPKLHCRALPLIRASVSPERYLLRSCVHAMVNG